MGIHPITNSIIMLKTFVLVALVAAAFASSSDHMPEESLLSSSNELKAEAKGDWKNFEKWVAAKDGQAKQVPEGEMLQSTASVYESAKTKMNTLLKTKSNK